MKIKYPSFISEGIYLNIFFISFTVFAGHFAILALFMALGFGDNTRLLTIPLRLLINLLALFHIVYWGVRKKTFGISTFIFYLFSSLYLGRVIFELVQGENYYHIPTIEFLLYYISFAMIPFLFFLQMKSKYVYSVIWKAVFSGTVFFSLISIYLYGSIIGTDFVRISTVEEELSALNPLTISYCASLLLGLSLFAIIHYQNKKLYILSFILGLIPFYLGSSRGGMIALLLTILYLMLVSKGLKGKIKYLFWSVLFVTIIFLFSQQSGGALFERFLSIPSDISLGNSSAYRIVIWEKSLEQFMGNPIFGNSLESNFAKTYPHNILIESLITTGIFGFILLLILLLNAFKKVFLVLRYNREQSWIAIIFIQALTQYMVSGSIYLAVWLWSSLGLLFSIDLKNKWQK